MTAFDELNPLAHYLELYRSGLPEPGIFADEGCDPHLMRLAVEAALACACDAMAHEGYTIADESVLDVLRAALMFATSRAVPVPDDMPEGCELVAVHGEAPTATMVPGLYFRFGAEGDLDSCRGPFLTEREARGAAWQWNREQRK